jgi:hypothetical protein
MHIGHFPGRKEQSITEDELFPILVNKLEARKSFILLVSIDDDDLELVEDAHSLPISEDLLLEPIVGPMRRVMHDPDEGLRDIHQH